MSDRGSLHGVHLAVCIWLQMHARTRHGLLQACLLLPQVQVLGCKRPPVKPQTGTHTFMSSPCPGRLALPVLWRCLQRFPVLVLSYPCHTLCHYCMQGGQ
eukprot:scaffold114866_cov25-Tisochrysis_lutea.AAC.1